MSQERKTNNDELILQVLREVLARQEQPPSAPVQPSAALGDPPEVKPPPAATGAATRPAAGAPTATPHAVAAGAAARPRLDPETGLRQSDLDQLAQYEEMAQQPIATDGSVRRLMARLVLGLLLVILMVNVPLPGGLSLARALPDSKALIVRDGLVFKGAGPQVYVLEGNHKRWISSLDAFTHFGYRWSQVHQVSDDFVARFPAGRPLHVLLKCPNSPHIYRLEEGSKRWIKDIATFTAEGHVWEDVSIVSCSYLYAFPDGVPIPADAGTPP